MGKEVWERGREREEGGDWEQKRRRRRLSREGVGIRGIGPHDDDNDYSLPVRYAVDLAYVESPLPPFLGGGGFGLVLSL